MRLLYAGFEKLLRGAEKLDPKLVTLPVVSNMTTTMIFLGTIKDVIEVEIKADKKTTGWLYNKNSIVFFFYQDALYEIFISTLKEITEEKLVAKKMIPEDEVPSPGTLKRSAAGKIVGYLAVEDVINVSNKINQEGCPTGI